MWRIDLWAGWRLVGALLAVAACGAGGGGGSTDACGGDGAGGGDGGAQSDARDAGGPSTDLGAAVLRTTSGPVKGVRGDGVAIFRGIPYAAAPVGARRWRAPEPIDAWTEMRDAAAFGKACMQPPSPFLPDTVLPGPADQSEDCLTLNAWTPAAAPGEGLPVMVWIHGGGWNIGAGSLPTYEGTHLSRDGKVVLVTFNYRLGTLGFMAHPELSAEALYGSSGNYGMLDTLRVLEWVQGNARELGGNPGNVTVFGESAGGGSVCYLLVSPLGKGLFHRAIVESANCVAEIRDLRTASKSWTSGEGLGLTVEKNLGCSGAPDPLGCMRSAAFADLVRAGNAASGAFDKGEKFWPLVDGRFLAQQPGAALRAGAFAAVPVMAGNTADEAALFRPAFAAIDSVARFESAVKLLFGAAAPSVLDIYPVTKDAEALPAYERLITDLAFVCPTRRTLSLLAAGPAKSNLWRFHFARVHPSGAAAKMGAYHGTDLFYVFHNLDPFMKYGPLVTADDVALSDAVIAQFARFAAGGDPNLAPLPAWPAFEPAADPYLVLDWPTAGAAGLRKAACDLFDSFARP